MFSILTPTYNRAYTLERLFKSLCQQSDLRFEWIVVDDGSTDDTCRLLNAFVQRAPFPINILMQANSGKHVAINSGVEVAKGEWCFIVDSDDCLTNDAIGVLHKAAETLSKMKPVGMCFRRADLECKLLGSNVPAEMGEMSFLHPSEAKGLYNGDLAYVFTTTALRKHPFPVFINEKFVPELLVWNKVGDEGAIAYFHRKVIYKCEYLPDGYSANFFSNLRRNPAGFAAFYKQQVARENGVCNKVKCFVRWFQCFCFQLLRRLMS